MKKMSQPEHRYKRHRNSIKVRGDGAGEGNRTPVFSLGSCCSTIELHPRNIGRFILSDRILPMPKILAFQAFSMPSKMLAHEG